MAAKGKPIKLVLVGKSGAGKSSSGNTILGRDAFISAGGPSSVTNFCSKEEDEVFDRLVTVVDTPGLFDNSQAEPLVKKEISKCINMSAPGPHAFLMVIKFGRFSEKKKEALLDLEDLFGADIWKFTIVIFTHGDSIKGGFDTKLKNSPPALKQILEQVKYRYQVFNNLKANDRSQVLDLFKKVDKMVSDNGGKHYTNPTYLQVKKMLDQRETELKNFYEKKLEEEIKALESKYKEKPSEANEYEAEVKELKRFYKQLEKRIRPTVEEMAESDMVDHLSSQINEKLRLS